MGALHETRDTLGRRNHPYRFGVSDDVERMRVKRLERLETACEVALAFAVAEFKEKHGYEFFQDESDQDAIIIDFNDAEGRSWQDVRDVHDAAIVHLIDGTCPIKWSALGELWANDPDPTEDDQV